MSIFAGIERLLLLPTALSYKSFDKFTDKKILFI